MKTRFRIAVAALLSVCAFASHAASDNQALGDCVALGDNKEVVRTGNGQQFFIKDGEAHYRVVFKNDCDSIALTSKLEISTNGQLDQLCPQGTKVKTNRDTCQVGKVERIDANEFTSRKRARR